MSMTAIAITMIMFGSGEIVTSTTWHVSTMEVCEEARPLIAQDARNIPWQTKGGGGFETVARVEVTCLEFDIDNIGEIIDSFNVAVGLK